MEIKTMDLSFCNTKAHNVVNKEGKQYILDCLEKHKIKLNTKRAYILHNKTLQYLEKTQHIISIKSSGTNYYLFFTNINNINYCFYIDRKIKPGYSYPRIISVKYAFDDIIFKDTLLDGELIKNENDPTQWMFLITDIILCCGEKLECNIINRFNKLYKILNENYKENLDLDICPLVVKKLFLYKDYDNLITMFIPSLPYKTKGLYFNSLNTKHANQLYLFNNNSNNNHNKHNKHKKVDTETETDNVNTQFIFKLQSTNTPEIYDLYCNNNRNLEKYGVACIPNLRTKMLIQKNLSDGICYVNCKYNEKFSKYQPISVLDIQENSAIIDLSKLK